MDKTNHDLQFSYEFAKIKSEFERTIAIGNTICLALQLGLFIGFFLGKTTK